MKEFASDPKVDKMKKIIVGLVVASMLTSSIALAHDREWREPPRREHRGGGVNPWPFIAGAVVGGIIVNEVISDREEYRRPPMRYVNVCENIELYDQYGRYVRTERRCRRELVPVE